MKRFYIYTLLLLVSCSFIAGCDKMENDFPFAETDRRGLITPYCTIENNALGKYVAGNMGTKALISATTPVDTILCNFLVIDENQTLDFDAQDYKTQWQDAYVSEASISTIPDGAYRSIALQPERPYHDDDKELKTRMIGWYPRTCDLIRNSDRYAITPFSDFTNNCITDQENNSVSVRFTGLDGSKDIMVSDIREGSYNNPFGESNSFTFKHYLSAIRVHAKANNSSQDLGMWGEINKVIVMNQPSSCKITLPQDCFAQDGPTGFAADSDVEWENETAKNPLVTTALFGEKDINNPDNLVAEEYPVKISGIAVEKYLGYSLIKPNSPLWLQVHTKAGVYEIKISNEYTTINENTHQEETVDIFHSGKIYDIHLNFNTDGTISVFLLNDGLYKFYDLTTGTAFTSEETYGIEHKWSNCYIIPSVPDNSMKIKEVDESYRLYDGFCFDATIVGNGEAGLLSFGAQSLYPTNVNISPASADILWETSPGLITQVELLFGYVRFKVAKDTTDPTNKYKEGNAVIAVYDKSGKILWSWHIWITDKPADQTFTMGNTKITLLDRNLGATAAKWEGSDVSSGEVLETYGLYYQWGRKDPSMGPPSADYSPINMTTAPYYDYSSDMKSAAEVLRLHSPALRDAVENPMYIILPTTLTQTYYFNWLYEKIDFLWGYDKDEGTNEKKTIYDPCPHGYKVPGGELGSLFGSGDSQFENTEYGQKVTHIDTDTTFYFPYTGYKGVDRGLNSLIASWKYVGQKADYQSAVVQTDPDMPNYMHRRRHYLSYVNQWTEVNVEKEYLGHQVEDHTNRRTAAVVRCVKNEAHNRISAFITPSSYSVSGAESSVNLQLYAKSFGAPIVSATLSVGYHLEGHGDTEDHKEYEIYTWAPETVEWTDSSVNFDFSQIKNIPGGNAVWNENTHGYIDITQTTGSIRFTLHVKTSDNINRIATTTVSLSSNKVEFDDSWNNKTVIQGAAINKYFTIYSSTIPVKVDMIKVNSNGEEVSTVDIADTDHLKESGTSDGSGYSSIYQCSTEGLSFDSEGWNGVKFEITFENDETFTTDINWFKVVTWTVSNTPLSSVNFDPNKYYLISNNYTKGYLLDNGEYFQGSTSYSISNLFTITGNNTDGYTICNLKTGHYAVTTNPSQGTHHLMCKAYGVDGSPTAYKISNNGTVFSIYHNILNSDRYWRQNSNSSNVTLSTTSNTRSQWIIYEVTIDEAGIDPNPPVQ